MKRYIIALLAIAMCLSTTTLHAQDQTMEPTSNISTEATTYVYTGWKHNLRISASMPGLLSALFTTHKVESSSDITSSTHSAELADVRYYKTMNHYFPGINIEYSYGINKIIHVGAKLTCAGTMQSVRHCATSELLYRDDNLAIGAIVNLRFDWLRKRNVQMYSSIGLGLAARFSFNNNILVPMYDATYVGASFGRSLYGFVEVGGGISGLIRTGIGYRF